VEVWRKYQAFIGRSVVVGDAVAFDLGALKRECERAGLAWHSPIALDTRLLAQSAEPHLADYSLERLAAWLDVEITGRHSALGDATAAAQIFCRLIPKLRDRGIRTLAEALRAQRELPALLENRRDATWSELPSESANALAGRERTIIDNYPYRHRIGAIMTAPARLVRADASIGAALETIIRERISSVFVHSGPVSQARPQGVGIVTERDILRTLNANGASALTIPVISAMSSPLITVSADAFAYVAIGRMNRMRIRHLGVTDEVGRVTGALSARDLLKLRTGHAIELGDEIEQAENVRDLGRAWAKLSPVIADLIGDNLSAREAAAIVSHQICETTRRAVVFAEKFLEGIGHGKPPCGYSFLALGSAARGESLLAMDQDNALVFADDAPADADRWFEALAARVADVLHEVGVPYCKGGVMARNPLWRGRLATWRDRIGHWIQRSSAQDLLAVDIFFDLRAVHGEFELGNTLRQHALDASRGQVAFAKLLVEGAGSADPVYRWFGGFRTTEGRIDLKKTGLFAIVSMARALAICHRIAARSTLERLDGIKKRGIGLEQDLDDLADAHGVFLDLILRQQIIDVDQGIPPSNAVEVGRLSRRDRNRLRGALKSLKNLDAMTRDLLFKA
jgi:DNA polymerase-3 subunit epsilon/CBS domain-containing protein